MLHLSLIFGMAPHLTCCIHMAARLHFRPPHEAMTENDHQTMMNYHLLCLPACWLWNLYSPWQQVGVVKVWSVWREQVLQMSTSPEGWIFHSSIPLQVFPVEVLQNCCSNQAPVLPIPRKQHQWCKMTIFQPDKILLILCAYKQEIKAKGETIPVLKHYAKMWEWRYSSMHSSLGTRWKWTVRSMVQQLYFWGKEHLVASQQEAHWAAAKLVWTQWRRESPC